uniref:Uncharacterized protein n=1 Tax=Rhizophora mucronata TaxID=61149 RepID=A0A2P2QGK6_RHIMU
MTTAAGLTHLRRTSSQIHLKLTYKTRSIKYIAFK